MVEIKFSGTTTENLIRQIAAFAEKVEVKEAPKHGKGKREKQTSGPAESDLGQGQSQQVP